MEGLYLYCLRESAPGYLPPPTKGIDGNGEVFVLPFRDLEAIVSEVALEGFASAEVQRRAQEDVGWIREKAILHARVVQEAMRGGPILFDLIPMRFGTLFENGGKLMEVLERDYSRMKDILGNVRGKQEWTAKVYLKCKRAFEESVKERNAFIREKEREIGSLPEGIAYFLEEELKEVVSREIDKALEDIVTNLHETLGRQASDSVRCNILGKELTGRVEPMVFNGAYLLPAERMDEFKTKVEELNLKLLGEGLQIEYSGPWPAYNFTSW